MPSSYPTLLTYVLDVGGYHVSANITPLSNSVPTTDSFCCRTIAYSAKMSKYDPSAPNPTQYRPYEYVPYIPTAVATGTRPFRQFSPPPSRIKDEISKAKGKENANKSPNGSDRRRTGFTSQRPNPGHSAPTIAKSSLTASVSTGDLSQPSPNSQRQPIAQLRRRATPTRIPSPKFARSPPPPVPRLPDIATLSRLEAKRFVSTPLLPSQKKHVSAQSIIHNFEKSDSCKEC